jgi:hypothetical protein
MTGDKKWTRFFVLFVSLKFRIHILTNSFT